VGFIDIRRVTCILLKNYCYIQRIVSKTFQKNTSIQIVQEYMASTLHSTGIGHRKNFCAFFPVRSIWSLEKRYNALQVLIQMLKSLHKYLSRICPVHKIYRLVATKLWGRFLKQRICKLLRNLTTQRPVLNLPLGENFSPWKWSWPPRVTLDPRNEVGP
jgi:hypothetical protein